jgi:hypothetical protein
MVTEALNLPHQLKLDQQFRITEKRKGDEIWQKTLPNEHQAD